MCGVGMYGHWFTRSQFNLIPEKRYRALTAAYPGHFARPWSELKREWDRVNGGPTSEIQSAQLFRQRARRRPTCGCSRASLETKRHGHATPKPVAMMGA